MYSSRYSCARSCAFCSGELIFSLLSASSTMRPFSLAQFLKMSPFLEWNISIFRLISAENALSPGMQVPAFASTSMFP